MKEYQQFHWIHADSLPLILDFLSTTIGDKIDGAKKLSLLGVSRGAPPHANNGSKLVICT
jgi:hypothetical protein